MSKITGIISAALGLALVKRFTDSIKDEPTLQPLVPSAPVTPDPPIVPIIPTGPATPAKPVIPFITVKKRAEQAAFIARQAKQTRDQLFGRFGL